MRRMFVLLIGVLPICATHVRAVAECVAHDSAVTVQIHDYEHLPSERLVRAREIVTGVYDRIGVRIDWLQVLQQDTHRARGAVDPGTPRVPVAQITVIILTPKMAARGRIPEGILGYAAVPVEQQLGRIAYVIYDRVRQVAAEDRADEVELLGFVVAHETGHLLLGRGATSTTGLMKCAWDHSEMAQFDALDLRFTDLQALRIRDRLMNPPGTTAALANGDSGVDGACEATSHADRSEREAGSQDRPVRAR